MTDELERIW